MRSVVQWVLIGVLRLVFLGFGAWVGLVPDALPGAHPLTRIALASVFLVFAVLLGEFLSLKTRFDMLIRAVKSATARTKPDPTSREEAIGILIRTLDSKDSATREKAHRHLVRLTGQDLPPDSGAWEAWQRGTKEQDE